MPPTAAEITDVRFEAGLAEADMTTISDDRIIYLWDNGGQQSVLLTAALVCERLANQAAVNFRWNADGQSIDKTMLTTQWRQAAIELRRRYQGTTSVVLVGADTDEDEDEFA